MFLNNLKQPRVTPWQWSETLVKRPDEGILRLSQDADSKRAGGWIS